MHTPGPSLPPETPDSGGDSRDARRADFVAATLACLAEYGYQGTTVRRIAERAGVAPGLLTHYFSGKDALVAAAYRTLGGRFSRHFDEQIAAAGKDPKARLAAFIRASFRSPNLDPDLLKVWVNFWSLIVNDPEIRRIHAENYADYRTRVAGLVEAVMASEDRQVARRDLEMLAIGISALLDGLWLELCLDQSVFDTASGEQIALEMIATRIGVPIP
ncbi:transcriptional regulator BetI [Microbaculum marinum]|uniref:Transcriptional regulator BetI n=1 Tax=Microbaculum marinum TaxID=1764581 RepID=A0AAW9RSJ3_9HYPH